MGACRMHQLLTFVQVFASDSVNHVYTLAHLYSPTSCFCMRCSYFPFPNEVSAMRVRTGFCFRLCQSHVRSRTIVQSDLVLLHEMFVFPFRNECRRWVDVLRSHS